MADEVLIEELSTVQLWAKLQETTIQKKERATWLDFYEERLAFEKRQMADCAKIQKRIRAALEQVATPAELDELMRWSL